MQLIGVAEGVSCINNIQGNLHHCFQAAGIISLTVDRNMHFEIVDLLVALQFTVHYTG